MMTKLSPRAHAIMEAYYNIDTTEEDGIIALLRELVYQLQYYNFGECGEDMILDLILFLQDINIIVVIN